MVDGCYHEASKIPMLLHIALHVDVVFPVLGLQSYNTQGECWFDPKIFLNASLKDGKFVYISETLKERFGICNDRVF